MINDVATLTQKLVRMLKITNTYELVITRLKLNPPPHWRGKLLMSYLNSQLKDVKEISNIAPYNIISFEPYGFDHKSTYKEISENEDILVLVLLLRIWLQHDNITIKRCIAQLKKHGFYTN